MKKKEYPVYQVSSEYSDCLEKAFVPESAAEGGAASEARPQIQRQFLGAMGNTPLGTLPFGEISEDTVHLSIWAEWGVERETLFSRLHRCQLDARGRAEQVEPSEDMDVGELDFDPDQFEAQDESAISAWGGERYIEGPGNNWLEFGNQLWRVKAHGIGGKDGRSYYPYAIQAGGILIGFRRDKHETVSNMWIEMGSIPLAQYDGLEGVWKQLLEMFTLEGIHVEKNIVSRVDIYTDFPDIDVSEFCDRFHKNQRVTRARKIGFYEEEMNVATYMIGMRQTGFSIGTAIKLRVYDKRYELQKDPIKWGVFTQKYGRIPNVLTRVEFQLRRVVLKEFLLDGKFRIEGVDSYLKAREQLWLYLTEDWFRLTEGDIDTKNRHQDRAETWSVWKQIQKCVSVVVKEVFRHPRSVKIECEALYKQAMGCICKMVVYEGTDRELDTAGSVLRYFCDKVRERGSQEFWEFMNRHYDDMHNRLGFEPLMEPTASEQLLWEKAKPAIA